MPSTVASLFSAAGLDPEGVVRWGTNVPEAGRGVYVVALAAAPGQGAETGSRPQVSERAVESWLEVRPELRLDGERPSVAGLLARLERFCFADETVLYVGLAGTSLRSRVGQFYKTLLGARRPHAGGHFLKTLADLDELHVHWSRADDPADAEDVMLAAFAQAVSQESRHGCITRIV